DRPAGSHPRERGRARPRRRLLGELLPVVDERRYELSGPVSGQAPAVRDLRAAYTAAVARLRHDAPPALALDELQPVPQLAEPVAVRRPRRRLDRQHAGGARTRRLLR